MVVAHSVAGVLYNMDLVATYGTRKVHVEYVLDCHVSKF